MDRKMLYFFLALFVFTFLLKAYYLDKVPFQFDETMYTEMIAEEAEHITFLPTYLGMWAPWKPGLFFIVYSLFLPVTSNLFTSLEWIYRSPNLLFGAINAFLFFLLAKRFLKQETALAAALLFYSSWAAFYVEVRLLMEVFMLTPVLLSLLFYTDKKMPNFQRFAGAALFAFAAALTKSVIALMLIPLALAFIFQNDRKNLLNPAFLFSLLAPIVGLLIFAFSLSQIGMMEGVLFKDTGKFFVYDYTDSETTSQNLITGACLLLSFAALYLIIAFRKMLSSWKQELFFSIWLLLAFLQVFSGQPHPWYLYYVMPALCFFAASAMEEKGKFDKFSVFILLLVFIGNLLMLAYLGPEPFAPKDLYQSKEIGLSLAGKENVLFVGQYYPISSAITYKILTERENEGHYLDFGYVLYHYYAHGNESPTVGELADSLSVDYYAEEFPSNSEFAKIFWTTEEFRKNTSIEKFDYIVIAPSNATLTNPDYELEFNGTMTAIYKRS